MALPKLETPTYNMKVPSTGEEIKYRPFLVKEEKILLLAMEENKQEMTNQAVLDLVNTCTFGKVGSNNDPMFDIEYAFIKIRQKSISETVVVNLLCQDDKKTYVSTEINLDDVQVTLDDEHTPICSLGKDASGNDVSIELTYPTAAATLLANKASGSNIEQIFAIVKSCIKVIHFGNDAYNIVDIYKDELDEFVDSLTQEQFASLNEFFDSMPKLTHDVEITNPNTGVKSTVHLEGLADFLN